MYVYFQVEYMRSYAQKYENNHELTHYNGYTVDVEHMLIEVYV